MAYTVTVLTSRIEANYKIEAQVEVIGLTKLIS